MQKYETASDRLKPSHLLLLANILGVEIDFFFEDVPLAVSKMSRLERERLMPTELSSHRNRDTRANTILVFARTIANLDANAIRELHRKAIAMLG